MLKRILDHHEALTHSHLAEVVEKWGAQVFAKVRLADAISIRRNEISPTEFSFALKSHFDFVVCDEGHLPLFVVEYDGQSHSRPEQIARDKIKDALCLRFGLPLLRINSRYLGSSYRGMSLLAWFIHIWFEKQLFDDAQKDGHIPEFEVFDPASIVITHSHSTPFPYWLDMEIRKEFWKEYEAGRLADPIPSGVIGTDSDGNFRAFIYIRVTLTTALYVRTGMRNQLFTISPSEILQELAVFDLHSRYLFFREDKIRPTPIDTVYRLATEFDSGIEIWETFAYSRPGTNFTVAPGSKLV